MKYRKRNPDGTFGELVETPGHIEHLNPEIQVLFEALAFMEMELDDLNNKFMQMEYEINQLKGSGQ